MGIRKKVLFIVFAVIAFLLILNVNSYAGSQSWKALDYDVTLNLDGSMNVVETWNIKISQTNTLFKNFDMTSGITNVKVSQVDGDIENQLKQIYQVQNHVDSGCYYALPLSNGKFEIAWNVGLDNSSDTRTYKLYYKIENVVTVYNDCAEFYWMFLSTSNSISGNNVTGTIHLPSKVSNIEKLRVWAHGDLSGNIERISEDTVKFSLPSLDSNSMLEVRVVTEENIYETCENIIKTKKLDSILAEEQAWADKANQERVNARKTVCFFILVNIFIGIFFVLKIKKYIKQGKELKEKFTYSDYDIEYFRDIPDENNATPARAAYMLSFSNTKIMTYGFNVSKVFSATLLDLSLKGVIEFEAIDEKNIRITLNENNKNMQLPEDERLVYEILLSAMRPTNSITIKEFENYARKHYEEVYGKINSIKDIAGMYEETHGKIDLDKKTISKKLSTKMLIYLILIFVLICAIPLIAFLPILYIGIILCFIVNSKIYSKFSILSEEGNREQIEWNALKKYMEDYSLLKEKQVPDIVLWEKFLVYATAFGISKKVLKQLKVVHPEMFNNSNDSINDVYHYGYWNLVCNNFGDNVFENLSSGLENVYERASSAYSAAHSSDSSGSGSGGGFSSGGGGRRRRRRLRRSLIYPKHILKICAFLYIKLKNCLHKLI